MDWVVLASLDSFFTITLLTRTLGVAWSPRPLGVQDHQEQTEEDEEKIMSKTLSLEEKYSFVR